MYMDMLKYILLLGLHLLHQVEGKRRKRKERKTLMMTS